MWGHVDIVYTDVSEERIASILAREFFYTEDGGDGGTNFGRSVFCLFCFLRIFFVL
jgi:hypothetical protein